MTGQATRDEDQALVEVGALPRKPDYWGQQWVIADNTAVSHQDIYVSVDGKYIVSASGYFNNRYSNDFGTTWNNGNVNVLWTSVCGTSQGSKIFGFATFIAQNQVESLIFYTSANQGANWTQRASTTLTGLTKVNRVRCSGDGTYVIATVNNSATGGRFLFSINGMLDTPIWTSKQLLTTLPSGRTQGACMARSGATQFITWINDGNTDSKIFRSFDYGNNWTEVQGHIAGGRWTHIECDATGRFVWATRFDTVNNQTVASYRSDNYGGSWVLANMNSIEDIWVSGTGQFVAGIAVPNTSLSNIRYLVYSSDYGQTVQIDPVSNTTLLRTINGSADGSILVIGSASGEEGGFQSDGKIRISRQGRQNIQDLSVVGGTIAKLGGVYTLTNDVVLWASGSLITSTDTATPFMDWSSGNIDLTQYNIRYEIDCYWNYNDAAYPAAFIHIAPNNITASDYQTDPNTSNTFVGGVTHWTNMMAGGAWGGITGEFNQSYRNRFMGGFLNATSAVAPEYRCRTLLNGELRLQTRPTGQSGITDTSPQERNIFNRFTCNNYTTQRVSGSWLTYQTVGSDYQHSCMRVDGTATFAAETYWNSHLASGINRIGLRLNDGFTPSDTRPRGAQYIYRIFRVRK